VLDLLLGHLVGDDQQDLVALQQADLRQRLAGVAGRGLHDRAAGLQIAVLLGRLDHRHGDPVLDRAAGIGGLQLHEQAAGTRVEARDLDHGRVADERQG
jgi:hypothetical protein